MNEFASLNWSFFMTESIPPVDGRCLIIVASRGRRSSCIGILIDENSGIVASRGRGSLVGG